MTASPLIVVVDDLRSFPAYEKAGSVRYARDAQAGIDLLSDAARSGETIELLSLDHDLGITTTGEARDIRPLVLWLAECCVWGARIDITRIVAHSANPVGASFIVQSLTRWYEVSAIDAASQDAVVG